MTGLPPSELGADQVAVSVEPIIVAVTLIGADGSARAASGTQVTAGDGALSPAEFVPVTVTEYFLPAVRGARVMGSPVVVAVTDGSPVDVAFTE